MNLVRGKHMQDYLVTDQLTLKEKRLLYCLRVRMVQCKYNYKQKYRADDLLCPICGNHPDSQQGIFSCPSIFSDEKIIEEAQGIEYDDIYGTLPKQIVAVKLWTKILLRRNQLIQN